MITIDGSFGEGGGQILRTSLALSLITKQPFQIHHIRGNRKKPGLKRQHLTCVQAAKAVGSAVVRGAELNSQKLYFEPHGLQGGHYDFSIGTAGSTTLVLQTVLPALLMAEEASTLIINGGTHNPLAPSIDFLNQCFLPHLKQLGANVSVELERPGFFPRGAGQIKASISPVSRWNHLELLERGRLLNQRATIFLVGLPFHIAEREKQALKGLNIQVTQLDRNYGQSNLILLTLLCENVTEVLSVFGKKGLKAEHLVQGLLQERDTFLKAEVPVGEFLADQLLLPMTLGKGGSFLTVKPSLHTLTNIEIIQRFMDVSIDVNETDKGQYRVQVNVK